MHVDKIYVELTIGYRWGVLTAGIFDKNCTVGQLFKALDEQVRQIFIAKEMEYVPYKFCFTMDRHLKDSSKRLKDFPATPANGSINYDQLYFWACFPPEFIISLNRTTIYFPQL
jgi:hypothetical protein